MATANTFISSAALRRSRIYDPGYFLHSTVVSGAETSDISLFCLGSVPVAVRFTRRSTCQASIDSTSVLGSSSTKFDQDADYVPMPIVLIDQDTNSDATIVEVSFGDRLGALLDTVVSMDTGHKVEDLDMLERIRLTIINNLLKYHPESSEWLAMGEAFGIKVPEKLDVDIATHLQVKDDRPKRSLLCIETADRPGLLMEIAKIFADANLTVESAEIDTEGLVANDKFHVSYRGAALTSSLSQVLINCLRYYLRRPETDDDSYRHVSLETYHGHHCEHISYQKRRFEVTGLCRLFNLQI